MAKQQTDKHGNELAQEGVDRCWCGCKYWEKDRCIDCKTHVSMVNQSCSANQTKKNGEGN